MNKRKLELAYYKADEVYRKAPVGSKERDAALKVQIEAYNSWDEARNNTLVNRVMHWLFFPRP